MRRLLKGRRLDAAAERVLFALVCTRALAPSSKLAAAGWVNDDVWIDGLAATSDDACYRAMDWLLEIHDALEQEGFGQVANLLNLEVDLLFFDTTSTHVQLEEPDTPIARDQRGHRLPEPSHGHAGDSEQGDGQGDRAGFRSYGKSKDHRDDLPQVVIGMAVTRTGIPVRVWCWPGKTSDQALIRQVNDDLRDGTLARVLGVADRGFAAAENRRYLRRGDHHYIVGEKLRSGSTEAKAALSRQAATPRSPATCGSRKSASPTPSGSSSATTPSRPNVTPPSASGCWPTWKSCSPVRTSCRRPSGPSWVG
jgi:hypothetical protein